MVNENTDISEPEEFHEDNNPAPKVVDRNNYPGNTHRSKMKTTTPAGSVSKADKTPDRPKQQKVIQGEAVERKRGVGSKFAEMFKGDDVSNVGSYVLKDIVVPAVKAMLSEAVSGGVDRLLFGSTGTRTRPTSGTPNRMSSYTNYNRVSTNPAGRAGEADSPRVMSNRARSSNDVIEILIPTRGEAEIVLEAMTDAISQYEVVSVSDYYDLVGYTGQFTDQKWGWLTLVGSNIQRVGRDGFIINLPKPQPID